MKNYRGLMYKMQRVDPALIPGDVVLLHEKNLKNYVSAFTESTDPDFSTNSQFVHMFAWSMHFCEVCKSARNVKDLEDWIEKAIQRSAFLNEQKLRYSACLEDLEVFELTKIEEEKDILEALLNDVKNNSKQREAEMVNVQSRYTEFEGNFFSEVNAAKRQSKVSGV